MKLFSDTLRLYEDILAVIPRQDTDMHAKVQNRIRLLKQAISDYENHKVDDGSEDGVH